MCEANYATAKWIYARNDQVCIKYGTWAKKFRIKTKEKVSLAGQSLKKI